MEDTEGSRSYSSNDEIEAYFKDLDKRFQSKITLVETKISDINDINEDIFNLNSFEKNEYLIDNIDSKKKEHKAKKRHKKSKKREKKRENYRSRSHNRCCSKRSSPKNCLNSSKTENKVQDDYFSRTTSKKYNVTSNFDSNSNKVSKIYDFGLESATDKTPKQKNLENRLELFTFQHEKSPIDSDKSNKIQAKPAVNGFPGQKNYHFSHNSFDQYNLIQQFKKPDDCATLESRKENKQNVNRDEKKEHLTMDKNNFCERPVNFINSDSNFIKSQIDLTVSSLSKCFDQKETSHKKENLTEHVLGELINKSNDSDRTKDKYSENVITIKAEDDFESLRNKFREQLEERLFDKNDKKLLDKIKKERLLESEKILSPQAQSLSNSESDEKSIERNKANRKRKKKNVEKHSKSFGRKNRHYGPNREKKKSQTDDEDEDDENSCDEIFDNKNELVNSLRRSDRIKVIKTKKQVTKEQEIAEKMKKLTSSSDLNKLQDESEFKEILADSINSDQENSVFNQEVFDSKKTVEIDSNAEEIEKFEWPKDYQQIDENIYRSKSYNNKNKESKKMVCDCTYSEQERQMGVVACGIDCLNRMLLIECGNRCPCGEHCTNKNFKTKNNAKIVPFKTENKGLGLKTINDLKSETFLIEYVGEVIDLKEFKNRCETYSEQNYEHFYFMALQNDIFIDATKKGNISRFFNHSCDPNCETQKWTVNGELRIGFFTRRPVKANEELTFDYQFQTLGKKQQTCYCGSEKCRGFLGASSNSQLNNIWESDSDVESSVSELSSSENGSEIESDNKENKVIKKKNIKNPKRNIDRELSRQIKSIRSLSNKENVLKLCQLMFRTESLELRLEILDLLMNTKAEISLRLFMDYHGIKLLWGWMIGIDSKIDSIAHLECKLKILEVLSMLPVKNRTILEECKILVIVKRWSEIGFRPNFNNKISDSSDLDLDTNCWIENLLISLVNVAFEESERKNDHNYQSLCSFFSKIKSKAEKLYTEWSSLEIAFKIPKKQQIEERKEHEREVNELFKDQEEPSVQENVQNNSTFGTRYANKWNNRYKGFNKFYRSKPYIKSRFFWSSNNNQNISSMTKEQRRKLFEEKVRQEEEKAAAEAAIKTEQEEKLLNKDIPDLKWVFDSRINQWVHCIVPNAPSNLPFCSNPIFSPVLNPLQFPFQPIPVLPPPPPPPQPSAEPNPFTKIDLTDSSMKNLQQAILQIAHSTQEINKRIQQNSKKIPHCTSRPKSLSSISAKLPAGWKCKRNKKGMIYYYHIKTKKTQWNFPKASKTVSSKSKTDLSEVRANIDQQNELKDEDEKGKDNKLSPAITSTTTEKNENDMAKSINSEASTSGLVTASSNSFKAYRDQFREKLSKLIIKILQPFLDKDCKYGYIKNNEDFKHLARKFTHTIMEKEISRTTNLEELDLDKRIKLKAKDYICKYMQKFRDGYSKSVDNY